MSDLSRTVLPIPEPEHVGLTTYDAKDPETRYPPIRPLRPPQGAPNVLLVLLDDVGFGASSAFGGPVHTPTAERLAQGGLKYTRFHTTALCSPSRQALLTGRNHHAVGMGGVTEIATSAPGNNSIRPLSCAPLAETLMLNGYATAQFGKCHEVPVWETGPQGPFRQWPTGSGFEYFYGFVGGESDQYYPSLTEGTIPIVAPRRPEEGYHLTEDLADHACAWIREQKALAPDKPFFVYFAPGATHAPHHVPKAWADQYKGRFAKGWDALREETLARQKKLGVVPEDAVLTKRPEGLPAWDEMPEDLRPVLEREMEVYAGFLEHADHQVGRVVEAIEDLGILDDTLVFYIIGDNGASAEGTMKGTFNELIPLNGMDALETTEFLKERIDLFGTPEAHNHYAVGWAHALNAPYQWTKQVASHWGGTRNGTIVHWPRNIAEKGGLRHQFFHVIDVAPTILQAAHLPEPAFVNGIQQKPYQGFSMMDSFASADAPETHTTQYFELAGNRGLYHNGWTAVTKHRTPWAVGQVQLPAFDDDVWELYAPDDWTQAHDLAREEPEMLHRLQRLWLIEAVKNDVLPLDDRLAERFNSDLAGRPVAVRGDRQLIPRGSRRLPEGAVLNTKNKSHAITGEIAVPEGGASGVIACQGGQSGGWSLYLKEGVPRYCYNFLGLNHFITAADAAVPPGTHQVRMEFAYDGGGLGKGGGVTLYVDGNEVASGRVEHTQPFIFSGDETCNIGTDVAAPVSPEYTPDTSRFTGTVNWVELDIGQAAADADHVLSPKERYHVAMALQ